MRSELSPPTVQPAQIHEEGLRHQLSAGQMAMVAVGGSIGTGLLLGSGAAMEIAGPAVILSFVIAAFCNWTFAMALGELACAHPAAGSFGVYGDLYLNRFMGFLARAGYWVGIALNIGAEMVAAATYMAYWFPGVSSYMWILIFLALLLFINLRSVGSYGRFEFWFSMIKLITLVGFIVIGASLLLSGRVAAQYTAHGGFSPNGWWAPLIAMTYAVYSFGGGEMVAIASGESRSPSEIRRAVWITLFTLTLVYLCAVTVLVGVMPWNHAGVTESPFVTTLRFVKIPHASAVMNFVVLTAALSGANAALYAGSRIAFSLARMGWAPRRVGIVNHEGSPQVAVLVTSFGILVSLALVLWVPGNAFRYMIGASLTGLLLSYLISLAAHVSFRRGAKPQELAALPLRSPLGMWGSVLGFIGMFAVLLQAWMHPLVNLWSGLACAGILTCAYLVLRNGAAKRAQS
jgi:L-asparagine transporter-like permease